MMLLDIAGIGVALDIADEAMAARVRARYAEFIVAGGQPQVQVRVVVVPGARFVTPRPGPWVIETALTDNQLTFRSYYDAGWVNFERGEGFLELAPETEIENFLRVIYAHLCLRAGGLLLHAAGIVKNNSGFVFFGPSGSGKSTIAQLSLAVGYTVLSDDLVLIKKQAERYRVYGVPFYGAFQDAPRTRMDVALAGVYGLVQAGAHHLERLTPAQAVAQIVRSVPFVMSLPAASSQIITFCRELNAQTSVSELHFRKDANFWRAIDESIRVLPDPA